MKDLVHVLDICISNVSLWVSYRNYYFINDYEAKKECNEVELGVVWIISKANSEMVCNQSPLTNSWWLRKVFTYFYHCVSSTLMGRFSNSRTMWDSWKRRYENFISPKNVGIYPKRGHLAKFTSSIRHDQLNTWNLEEKWRAKVGQI